MKEMYSLVIFKSDARGMRYGIGTYITNLTRSLLDHSDVSIIIVNFHSDSCKEYKAIDKSRRYKEIFIPSPKKGYGTKSENLKYASRVVDLLSATISNSGNVIFQVNYIDALPIARILRMKYSFPIISIVHSAQWQFIFDGNKLKFIESWASKSDSNDFDLTPIEEEKELYELSDKIISVTDYMKEFLIEYYQIPEEKISVVHNGIDASPFQILSREQKDALKQKLGFRLDEKIVLFSGRLDSSKGIYFLLDAFAEVINHYENIRLVLIGEDSGPDRISQYLKHCTNIWSKITFTGFLEYEYVLKLYQIADVGVVPSIYDHCTYVAPEMIGHNIPLVVSNAEGFNEILTKDQCIYLIQLIDKAGNITYDKIEFARAILLLITDEEKAKQISKDYQELITTKLSVKIMANEMYSIIKNLTLALSESL